MDPREITGFVTREIALNGPEGIKADELWDIAANHSGGKIDAKLRSALEKWVVSNSDVVLESGLYKASEDSQWLELTGSPKTGSSIGQKAFELLCVIARSRGNGISTVNASKVTGQDFRSLFGRAQTLVNAQLISRYPIIEGGYHTNMMIFHAYTDTEPNSASEAAVDKNEIYRKAVEYIRSGHNSVRLMSEVTEEVSKVMPILEKRKKPALRRLLRELELNGFIRKILVNEPNHPDRQVACLEYITEYNASKRNNQGSSIGLNISFDDAIQLDDAAKANTGDENDEDDEEDIDDDDDENADGDSLSTERSPERRDTMVNLIFPLANQIHDLVRQSGSNGTSIMELSKKLTGRYFKKCLSKYLDALTADSTNDNENLRNYTEHLSLVKGVDFNKRVKFYRYFSKPFFLKVDAFEKGWGVFPEEIPVDSNSSLRIVSKAMDPSLPGNCTIVKTKDGDIKPSFHGDRVVGEVILRSGPASDNPKKKKLGRPRKYPPKIPPADASSKNEESEKNEGGDSSHINTKNERLVSLASRKWIGGKFVGGQDFPPSMWLDHKFEKTEISDDNVPPNDHHQVDRHNHGQSVGSIALLQRIETLMKIISMKGGVVQGGSKLLDMFNHIAPGEHKIDRRTISNVCQKLINDGRLEQIFFNIQTVNGTNKVKTLFVDPYRIPDKDTSPLVEELKRAVIVDELQKRSSVAKRALEYNKGSLPVREVTQEEFDVIKPPSKTSRIKSMRSKKIALQNGKKKAHFGSSAADVLGIDAAGVPQPRSKKSRSTRGIGRDLSKTVDPSQVIESTGSSDLPLSTHTTPQTGLVDSITVPEIDPALHNQDTLEDSEIDLDLLARTVIVCRSFFNTKLSKPINWRLVAESIPGDHSIRAIRRSWSAAKDRLIASETDVRSADIVFKKLQEFEDLFMSYYEKGEVEFPEDLSDAAGVIARYVDWWANAETEQKNQLGETQMDVENNDKLDSSLSSLSLCDVDPARFDIDPFVSLQGQPSFVNAEKMLARTSYGVSFTFKYGRAITDALHFSDAELKLRAMIAADEDSYNPQLAAMELSGLSNEETEAAISSLVTKRIIRWCTNDDEKIAPGRPYVLSDNVNNALAPKLDASLPLKAAEKLKKFDGTVEAFEIPPTVSDSEVFVLLEYATHGIDHRNAALYRSGENIGLLSDNYKSRGIDKQEFECKVEAQIFHDGKEVEGSIVADRNSVASCSDGFSPQYIPPPHSNTADRPWLWQTRFLSSSSIWYKVALRILSTVFLRPGITPEALYREISFVLTSEEFFGALDALREGGALTCNRYGSLQTTPDWFTRLIKQKN